jgi:AcrR family transcriptional regulator
MRAGERLFAERGIHGAQIRDIVKAGGQANDSAVHYHFGSREGLIYAICEDHILRMEPERRQRVEAHTPVPDLETLVTDMVESTASRLADESGRYFLRITAQLASYAGIRSGVVPAALDGTSLRTQLDQLREICSSRMPTPIALERITIMIGTLAATLADRAAGIERGGRLVLDADVFVGNLTSMLVAALDAPVPATRRRRRGMAKAG